jgi:hypothetical protein
LIIAPFALLPNFIGAPLWTTLNVWFLFFAVHRLPLSHWAKNIILLISLIEMLTSIQNLQFNSMLCSWIILIYVFIKEDTGKLFELVNLTDKPDKSEYKKVNELLYKQIKRYNYRINTLLYKIKK